MMNYYENLPPPPESVTSTTILQRLVDSLGFRYQLATKNLKKKESAFRPIDSSMSIEEVNTHIFHLIRLSAKTLDVDISSDLKIENFYETRQTILELIHMISTRLSMLPKEELIKKKIYLKRVDTYFPFWYLINGYLADVLTHVGQINSWRRMAGNPVSRISPFTGEAF